MKRQRMNRKKSKKSFKRGALRTNKKNNITGLKRGGIRA